MEKETYEVAKKYEELVNSLYMELTKTDIGMDELIDKFDKFDDFYDEFYKVGSCLDEEKYLNRDATIKKAYEDVPSYLKLTVVYEYGNGFSLCESTVGAHYLIPTELLTYL